MTPEQLEMLLDYIESKLNEIKADQKGYTMDAEIAKSTSIELENSLKASILRSSLNSPQPASKGPF